MRARSGLVMALSLVLLVGACHTTHSRTTIDTIQAPPESYRAWDVSFTYPANWNRVDVGAVAGVGGRLYPFVCLGTEPPVRCGEQPRRLRPSDVAVTWSQGDYGSGVSTSEPDLAPVPGACLALGAQGGTEVEYRSSPPNPEATLIHLVTACLRSPHLKTI